MRAVTHLEKVITGEVSAVTHLEKVIAEEASPVTYTEKVIAGEATPITHLQKVIAGIASPVTHLEQVWAGGSPTPSEHEYTGAVPVEILADGAPLLDFLISGNEEHAGTPSSDTPIMPEGTGDLETVGVKAGQYKIPISSAGTTTPVYLGEVETTRRVKKLVLDGTENWQLYNRIASVGGKYFNLSIATQERTEFGKTLCTHYTIGNPYDRLTACCVTVNYSRGIDIRVNNPSTDGNITDFKSYLAAQYAAGTPVTVWYVLANEETGVVNEPLMKIGDYADTLSMEQAGVQIPTLNGQTVVDVDTTLKPSEVYIKYKG